MDVFRVELIWFSDRLSVKCERKRMMSSDIPLVLHPSSWKGYSDGREQARRSI